MKLVKMSTETTSIFHRFLYQTLLVFCWVFHQSLYRLVFHFFNFTAAVNQKMLCKNSKKLAKIQLLNENSKHQTFLRLFYWIQNSSNQKISKGNLICTIFLDKTFILSYIDMNEEKNILPYLDTKVSNIPSNTGN